MADWRSDATGPDSSALDDLVARVIDSGAVSEVRRARLVTDGLQHIVVILDEISWRGSPATIKRSSRFVARRGY